MNQSQFQSNLPEQTELNYVNNSSYESYSYNESQTSPSSSSASLESNFQSPWNDCIAPNYPQYQVSTPYLSYPYSYSPIPTNTSNNIQQDYSTYPTYNSNLSRNTYNSQYDTTFYTNNHQQYNQYSDSTNNSSISPSSDYSLNSIESSLFIDAKTTDPVIASPPKQRRMEKNAAIKVTQRTFQLSDLAVEVMNEWYDEHLSNPYPQLVEKERMAKRGGITVKQVTAWFSNRRNRSQNTKPKRMRRVLEKDMTDICQELVNNPNKEHVIEKFRNTLANHEIGLKLLF